MSRRDLLPRLGSKTTSLAEFYPQWEQRQRFAAQLAKKAQYQCLDIKQSTLSIDAELKYEHNDVLTPQQLAECERLLQTKKPDPEAIKRDNERMEIQRSLEKLKLANSSAHRAPVSLKRLSYFGGALDEDLRSRQQQKSRCSAQMEAVAATMVEMHGSMDVEEEYTAEMEANIDRRMALRELCEEIANDIINDEIGKAVREVVAEVNQPSVRLQLTEHEQQRAYGLLHGRGSAYEVIADKFNAKVYRRDVQTLRDGVWLNDEVINFYLQLLGEAKPGMHHFNSFFVQKLLSGSGGYCYKNVRRWTRRVDLFAKDLVLVPININQMHWTLMAVDMRKKTISYYDSMSGNGSRYVEGMMRYLKDEMLDKKQRDMTQDEADSWQLIPYPSQVPQQHNGCDCGAFVCTFCFFLSHQLPVKLFSQSHIPFFRRHVALSIQDRQLLSILS